MILIVDDHQDTCELLARLCAKRGLPAKYVMTADDAIAAVQNQSPSVLVLDHMMPGATGLQVLERLKAQGKLENTQVVFVSAVYDWDLYQRAKRLGARAWLVKGTIRLTDVVEQVAGLYAESK